MYQEIGTFPHYPCSIVSSKVEQAASRVAHSLRRRAQQLSSSVPTQLHADLPTRNRQHGSGDAQRTATCPIGRRRPPADGQGRPRVGGHAPRDERRRGRELRDGAAAGRGQQRQQRQQEQQDRQAAERGPGGRRRPGAQEEGEGGRHGQDVVRGALGRGLLAQHVVHAEHRRDVLEQEGSGRAAPARDAHIRAHGVQLAGRVPLHPRVQGHRAQAAQARPEAAHGLLLAHLREQHHHRQLEPRTGLHLIQPGHARARARGRRRAQHAHPRQVVLAQAQAVAHPRGVWRVLGLHGRQLVHGAGLRHHSRSHHLRWPQGGAVQQVPERRPEAAPRGLDPAPGAAVGLLVSDHHVPDRRGGRHHEQLGGRAVRQLLVRAHGHHQLHAQRDELHGQQGHVARDALRVRQHEAGGRDRHVYPHQPRRHHRAEGHRHRRCIYRWRHLRLHLDEGDNGPVHAARTSEDEGADADGVTRSARERDTAILMRMLCYRQPHRLRMDVKVYFKGGK